MKRLVKTEEQKRREQEKRRRKLMRTLYDPTAPKHERHYAYQALGCGRGPKPGDIVTIGDRQYRIGKHGEHRRI